MSRFTFQLLVAACALAGCRPTPEPPIVNMGEQRISTTQQVTERPLPARAQPTLIKQGNLPLIYLCEATATLRIVDLTTGSELARALARPRQILRLDARHGVLIGDNVLRGGALASDHVYGIWLEPEGADNTFENTSVRPNIEDRTGPPRRIEPQTQPN